MTTPLEESARLAGSHVWTERRLFEILGGWVSTTPAPEAKLMLDRHSSHHAWRARQWWERLPVLADVDRDALVAPPSPGLARALELLAGLTPPAAAPPDATAAPSDATAARLAGAYRFALPRLWNAYARHRASAGEVADGSSLRTLGLVISDVTSDWQEGEARLQELLTGREVVSAASATVEALETALFD